MAQAFYSFETRGCAGLEESATTDDQQKRLRQAISEGRIPDDLMDVFIKIEGLWMRLAIFAPETEKRVADTREQRMSLSKEQPVEKRLDGLEERAQSWESVLRFRVSGFTALQDRCHELAASSKEFWTLKKDLPVLLLKDLNHWLQECFGRGQNSSKTSKRSTPSAFFQWGSPGPTSLQ